MIIHISGPSGSGKTTLGNKLEAKTKFKIIHTDDIDDKNSLLVLKTMKNKLDYGKFDAATADLNKKDIKKILDKYENIIFIGHAHSGMKFKIDHGYCIKIAPKELFKRYHNRCIENIIKYYEQLKKLIPSDYSIEYINMIVSKKYGIRQGFFCENDFIEDIKYEESRARKHGYKIINADDIYKNILKKTTIYIKKSYT